MRMLLLAAGAAALLVIPADAQQDRGGGQSRTWKFLSKKYDKNKDGKITFQEYKRDREPACRGKGAPERELLSPRR